MCWRALRPGTPSTSRSGPAAETAAMPWSDFVTVSPIVAAILAASAVLVVDLIKPGARTLAVGTALIGLAVVAAVALLVGRADAMAFNGAYRQDSLTTFLDT